MMKKFLLAYLLLPTFLLAQKISIIPEPVSVKPLQGTFTLTPQTKLVLNDAGEQKTADFFNDYLLQFYGFKIPVVKRQNAPASNYVLFNTKKFINAPENEGRYALSATPKAIVIEGDSYTGTFYGMQSLIQLLPVAKQKSLAIPAVTIDDYPRFSYRGMHLDVGRHFFPVNFIKRYIDFIALHKMNNFHWHLTEDQGWRIEIKKYPKLTEVGGWRNGTIIGRYPGKGNDSIRYGGYYTQDEVREVVQYAAERFINVIPEIEMPGHSSAAIAAYPHLSCFPEESTKAPAQTAWHGPTEGKQVQQAWGVFPDVYCAGKETTFEFLEDVIDEVLALFPSEYIHIGGDESPKTQWKRCPNCQKRIKEEGLKDEHHLQSYFIQRMEKYINSKGRKIIGWDEILEGGLAPNATVMSWQGEKGGIEAAKQNHYVIMTPGNYVYLDHMQTKNEDSVTIGGHTPLEEIYHYEPVPKELNAEQAKYVLGSQGNVWTEYMKNTRKVEYQVFPRMAALSEVLWSPKAKRDFKDFEKRMMKQFERYDLWNINYSKAYFELTDTIYPAKTGNGMVWSVTSKKNGTIEVTKQLANGKTETRTYTNKATVPITQTATVTAKLLSPIKGKQKHEAYTSLTKTFAFNKATGKTITHATLPSPTYPGNGGVMGLVNATKSERGFNSTEWLGWSGKDMDVVLDLGKAEEISRVVVNVWKQEPSWVYLPKGVDVYVSTDKNNWQLYSEKDQNQTTIRTDRSFTVDLGKKIPARYLRIVAMNHGTIAEGKPGAGRNAWLFVDEVEVH